MLLQLTLFTLAQSPQSPQITLDSQASKPAHVPYQRPATDRIVGQP